MPVGLERLTTVAKRETESEKKARQAEERKRISADLKRLNPKKDKKDKKKDKAEDPTDSRELDIGSDRDTKSTKERAKSAGKLSKKGMQELLYDMSKRGLELSNRERSRLGLPPLGKDPLTYRGPGKKSGGKVYARGSRKANYNG